MLDDITIRTVIAGLNERKATHIARQIEDYRRQISATEQQIESFRSSITDDLRQLAEERDLLQIAIGASEDRTYIDHLLTEWADLSAHPRLVRAAWADGTLELWTTDDIRLHREDSDETRWLGRFRIVLNLNNGQIRLHNLDTRRGGRDHPHVVNGSPCFGSDHGIFSELMSMGSLNVLYEMLLQYLEKLNLRDEYGAYGSYWFEQDDVRPEGAPRPAPEAIPMPLPQFAAEFGTGAEFTVDHGPCPTDTRGRPGRVIDAGEESGEIEWLDTHETDFRGRQLFVVGAVAVSA